MEVRSSAEPGLTISALQTHVPTLRGLLTLLSHGGRGEGGSANHQWGHSKSHTRDRTADGLTGRGTVLRLHEKGNALRCLMVCGKKPRFGEGSVVAEPVLSQCEEGGGVN